MPSLNMTKNTAQYVAQQQAGYGVVSGGWITFLDALGIQENSGKYGGLGGQNNAYAGMYQVGNEQLAYMHFTDGIGKELFGITSKDALASNPVAQDMAAIMEFSGIPDMTSATKFASKFTAIRNAFSTPTQSHFDQMVGQTFTINWKDSNGVTVETQEITLSKAGLSAAAHLVGQGVVAAALKEIYKNAYDGTGILISPTPAITFSIDGNYADGNGVAFSTYIKLFQGFDISPLVDATDGKNFTQLNQFTQELITHRKDKILTDLTTKGQEVSMTISAASTDYRDTIRSVLQGLGLSVDNLDKVDGNVILVGANDSKFTDKADLVFGLSDGKQILSSSAGDDILIGGKGLDNLKGGLGNDTYVYQSGDGADTITDTDNANKLYVGTTQLIGTTENFKPGTGGTQTWTVNGGETVYTLDSGKKTLTISGSALGGGSNSITLTDIADLKTLKDRYGITLKDQIKAAIGNGLANNFTTDPDYTPVATSSTINENGSKQTSITFNRPLSTTDKITLVIDSISGVVQDYIKLVTGDQILDFGSGSITLNATEGQNILSLALLEQGDLTANASVTFKAIIESTDADGAVTSTTSNLYTLDINGVDDTQPIQTTLTISGDIAPIDTDLSKDGIQADGDALNNPLGTAQPYEDILGGSAGNDHILSGELNDDVGGGGGDDWIEGGNGNDYIHGDTGNDLIEGGAASDILLGGNGNDRLYANIKIDTAAAIANGNTDTGSGQKSDWLTGDAGNDTLIAGAGNDVLAGGAGADLLIAGAGDDNILGDADYSAQYIWEDTPRYSIGSTDWYHTSSAPFNWTVTPQADGTTLFQPVTGLTNPPGGGADVIYAGAGDDHVWAGEGDDVVYGEGGNDRVIGEAGNDILMGGAGDDDISGDASYIDASLHGDDYIDGGAGNDTLYMEAGNDKAWGGEGADIILGGAGDDNEWREAA